MAGIPLLSYVSNLLNMDTVNLSDVKESNNQALLSMLDNLSSGETVVGKIISFDDNSYTFKTPENITVKARTEEGIQLKTGSTVMFEVVKRGSEGTKLRPLYTNTNASDTAAVALRQAGIPNEPRALEYTVRSMEYGAPIDRKSLLDGFKDVFMYKEAPVKYIVDLQKMNIPVTRESLSAYEAFSNMENGISESFIDISDAIADDFIGSLSFEGLENADVQNENSQVPVHIEQESVILDLGNSNTLTNEKPVTGDSNLAVSQSVLDEGSPAGESKPVLFEFLNDLSKTLDEGNPKDVLDSLRAIKNEVVKYAGNEDNFSNITSKETSKPGEDIKDLLKSLMAPSKPSVPNADEIKTVTPSLEDKVNYLKEDLKPLVKEVVVKLLNKNYSLDTEKMSDKREVKELYDRLYSDTKKLIKVLDDVLPKNSTSHNYVQNLNNNINFMDTLNHYVPYIQIPFEGENGHKTGELYVFRNNRSMASKEGELSAFVHLDTKNLGPADVYIKLKGEAVSTNFTLDNEESLLFIEKNLDYLNKRLNDKGYSFTGKVELNRDGKTPLEIMHENVTSKMLIAKNSFDARV